LKSQIAPPLERQMTAILCCVSSLEHRRISCREARAKPLLMRIAQLGFLLFARRGQLVSVMTPGE
jgi:hypothetical protein